MLSFVERLFPFLRPEEFLEIESESHSGLSLRCGRARTVFDRLSRAVTRNGKLVTTFGSIQHVRITEESTQGGPALWSVSLQLSGSRTVPIGRATDGKVASTAAARIATVTGARVLP
jgi:hypothetical protein